MGLLADRLELQTDISYFLGEVADRGIMVSHNTSGSGAAMDQGDATVRVPTGTGDLPVGLLLNDVVNKDLTKTHLNEHKDEVQINSKVTILRKGWVVTDDIPGNISPTAGDPAFLEVSGLATTTATTRRKIGSFLSAKNADGFAKLEVNLP